MILLRLGDRMARLSFWLLSFLTGAEFLCPECGWKGLIVHHPDCELVMGTYCPCCSDQR